MQLGAVIDRVVVPSALRILLMIAAWAVMVIATGWAILRAPGPELLTGLLTVPPIIGVIGVTADRRDRRSALGFLIAALGVVALLIPAVLERIR